MPRRRFPPHVRQKLLKSIPASANHNPPPPIKLPFPVLGVPAPKTHRPPAPIFRRLLPSHRFAVPPILQRTRPAPVNQRLLHAQPLRQHPSQNRLIPKPKPPTRLAQRNTLPTNIYKPPRRKLHVPPSSTARASSTTSTSPPLLACPSINTDPRANGRNARSNSINCPTVNRLKSGPSFSSPLGALQLGPP